MTVAPVRSTLFFVHLLPLRIRKVWWRLWSKDPHNFARCSFCGASRRETAFLLEAEHAYICEACIMLGLGAIAAKDCATTMVSAFASVLPDRSGDPATLEETDALLRALLALGGADTRAYGLVATHAARLGRDEIAREARAHAPGGYR